MGLKFSRYVYDEGFPPGCYPTDGAVNLVLTQHEGAVRPTFTHESEYIHLGLIVENLEETYHLLRAEGAEILVEDVKVEKAFDCSHVPVCSFKGPDPYGNILDITERKEEWDGVRL